MKRIALATSEKFASLTEDDRLLVEPLQARDIAAQAAVWSDSSRRWADYDAVILRSCWDYHLRVAEFLQWIAALEKDGVRLWNPPAMICWNANKTYLRDLESRGVPIVPTFWPEDHVDLREVLDAHGWEKAVVKPRVSATAHRTRLISLNDADSVQTLLEDLLRGPGVMVQEFMNDIQTSGEWSLIFFSGEFNHAVIKTPKAGDFRVQHDFGGAERSARAPSAMIDAASRILAALDTVPLYARVDGVESNGQFLLMELELIEPALFLSRNADAPERFARAIVDALSR
jgi:glutathione synthase/RimK-type ligase-like ATP-grasp enzyme